MKKPTIDTGESVILKALELIESDEMRTHLFKWLTSTDANPNEICKDIILNAPVPLEKKVQMLNEVNLHKYAREATDALNERYKKNHYETIYRLFMYDQPKETCKIVNSYADAIDYINRTRLNLATDNREFANHKYGRTDIIEKWIAPKGRSEYLHLSWFLDDDRNVLYFNFSSNNSIWLPSTTPGRLNFTVPFKPGDIVATDCRPFASEKNVVILENDDTFASVDGNNVTCLFINGNKQIDVGYFKFNEFLAIPANTYVSSLYRARVFRETLSKDEAILGVISDAIKKNAKLGNALFMFLVSQRNLVITAQYEGDPGNRAYFGTDWELLQSKFEL